MPELPEVETMRRGILKAVGQRIVSIEQPVCVRKPILLQPAIGTFRKRACGRVITAIDRLGKRVVVRLDNQDVILFEPRMTGLVLVSDPPSVEHLRFRMTLDAGPLRDIWYWDRRGLGSVRLFTPSQLEEKYGLDRLGPDPLQVSVEEFRSRFLRSRRPIKVALLDQKALAGIGNMYASEILHLAEVHPAKRCDLLTTDQWQAIHAATKIVLNTAIQYEGSTLSDGTYRNVLNDPGGYQNQHRVYDRAGNLCVRCQLGVIVRIVQAQRSTFFCPLCQTKKRVRKISAK